MRHESPKNMDLVVAYWLLIGNYRLRSSRGDIEYVKYAPWSDFARTGVDPMPERWNTLHNINTEEDVFIEEMEKNNMDDNVVTEKKENHMTEEDVSTKETESKIYDMRRNPPKKRWSFNWVTDIPKKKICKETTPSCNVSFLEDELPDLDLVEDVEDLEEPTTIPLSKEEREKLKQERIRKREIARVVACKRSLEETRLSYKPFQHHPLHKSICQIYTFINNNVLNRAFKPAEEMIFWSEHLGVVTLGMTINMPRINYVDSILFASRLTDLNRAYNVLIYELGHAKVTLLEDKFIPDHGSVFKKMCRQIMKGILQNRNLQPAEMKNLIIDREVLNAKF